MSISAAAESTEDARPCTHVRNATEHWETQSGAVRYLVRWVRYWVDLCVVVGSGAFLSLQIGQPFALALADNIEVPHVLRHAAGHHEGLSAAFR